jgi:hypothetical protein
LRSTTEEIVGDGDLVVALTVLDMMGREITYSQWFWLGGGGSLWHRSSAG